MMSIVETHAAIMAGLDRIAEELRATDELLADRQRVLDAIPPCPVHGQCVPHALQWIERMKKLDGKEAA